jgi:hypothetical protein
MAISLALFSLSIVLTVRGATQQVFDNHIDETLLRTRLQERSREEPAAIF